MAGKTTTRGAALPRGAALRVPDALRRDVEQIFGLTDPFTAEYLDEACGELVRRLVAKLARKRPSPLACGDLRAWAAAAIYTVCTINEFFDHRAKPRMTGDDLSALTGVPKSTMAAKARMIRDALRLRPMDTEFCRRELLEAHPTAWLIEVNGFLVDARMMPREILAEARRRGYVPDLSSAIDASAAAHETEPASGSITSGASTGGHDAENTYARLAEADS